MTWIFGSFLVTPCALTSCHAVMSKQGYDSTSGQSGTTGVLQEGDHVMRTTRSDLDSVQRIAVERGTRSRSDVSRLARWCKRWHPLASGRRYGKKSSLRVYVSPSIS